MDKRKNVSDTVPFDTTGSETEQPQAPDNFVDARATAHRVGRIELPNSMVQEVVAAQEEDQPERPDPRKNTLSKKPIIICRNQENSLFCREVKNYPMKSRPKGLFLCINNINFVNEDHSRRGSAKDAHALTTIFYKLGYHIHSSQDLDKQGLETKITQFSRRSELQVVDSVVVAVMSHGMGTKDTMSHVIGTDGLLVSCNWIVEQFNAAKCPAMHGKPKIFLFQLCRGNEKDQVQKPVLKKKTEMDGTPHSDEWRLNGDVFIANATTPGYTAHRDTNLGSWFVQELCRAYMQYACSKHLEDMHKIVDNHLRNYQSEEGVKQVSCYEGRGFARQFYFYPGIYN